MGAQVSVCFSVINYFFGYISRGGNAGSILITGERIPVFPFWLRTRQRCLLSSLLLSSVEEVIASVRHWGKEVKEIKIGKKEIKLSQFTNAIVFYMENHKKSKVKMSWNK